MASFRTRLRFHEDYGDDKHFPIVSLRDLVVAKATKVFTGFPWKAYVMDAPWGML